MIEYKCENCGKKCKQIKAKYKIYKHHYCGYACSSKKLMKYKKSYDDTLGERIKKLIKSGELKKGA